MYSKIEDLLDSLVNGTALPEDYKPMSRNEHLLNCLISGVQPEVNPQSRVEAYLIALCEKGIGGGSGGGGTSSDYPSAEGVEF